ncbi:MAG: hypothetical protein GEV08_00020 [Acidimicrobiia bacterium]|nr:hypothetical protein [Acidimicrobiia bacterium]
MAKPVKRKVPGVAGSGGRVTPKAGGHRGARAGSGATHARPSASARYTPPTPARLRMGQGGRLVPIAMLSVLSVGVLMIIINYMSVLLPGAPSNWYIVGGLGLILAGILIATQWQ